MSVAIEYLYKDIEKYEVKLVAGQTGLKNRVRWTHVVENEEIATFLQGQEMVFTTGIAIKKDSDLFSLVKKTREQNASAIVINIGKYVTDINQDIIDYCNENDYPLFLMPWDVRITDVMKILTMTIIESEKTYLEISNAIKDAIFLPTHEELYINTLKKIGFKSSWRYIVTIIEVESNDSSIHKIENHTSKAKIFIEDELNYIRHNFFSLSVGQSIIILFYNKSDSEIDNILKKLYINLDKNFESLNFYVGIGKHTSSLDKLYKGYEEAKNVAKINRLLRNNNVHIRYSELGLYRLLLGIENKDIMKEFHDEIIGDLENYDKINNTDYVELLINYFENNCKVNETANSLYIHRNTVNYKINKIQEILDLNLADIGDRSKIYLSLMIRYLI